jgi:predicted nucleic acid-binding protein
MNEVLLDTDVLIDHVRGRRHLEVGTHMSVSVITRTELYAGDQREEPAVQALLGRMKELDVNHAIARRAGRIKRDAHLKIADALIAATALEHQLPLMTRNLRHFERVAGLTIHDPPDQSKPRPQGNEPTDTGGSQAATPD